MIVFPGVHWKQSTCSRIAGRALDVHIDPVFQSARGLCIIAAIHFFANAQRAEAPNPHHK
jgi:hypothetical protein